MLKDTGERVIPEKMKATDEMLMEHMARYYFAVEYVYGRVLDIASGTGYGTQLLAKKRKGIVDEVVGVDLETEAIKYAKGAYHHPNATFIEGDVTDSELPEKLGQFDCIVSFETIEHIADEEQFLANIYNLLKPGGKLILSTPFGKGRGKLCGSPFHVHQLSVDEFMGLFPDYASAVFYFQKGPLIEPANRTDDRHFPLGIAVCRK
ncbi:class I SAM-dependent methyltransferase [Lentibacillus amyloliquefaciens]|uniref:SAM-dependent methyltransferase n=1 Tax=Lentibacillus amyloliquefaciens TaxID=1472767 RepID=A0A0U4FPC9_9BACI|nr:class I SAM-dependent methyltransferase [Lentibacillus amyloliquefaciens]ALX49604.1 SAM-dependent methyltransferase [Lentibacillus amyloliquefaciens]